MPKQKKDWKTDDWKSIPRYRWHDRLFLDQNGKCSICSMESNWFGRPLKFQIDHTNGVPEDGRRENIRLLCPNCHVQTHTHSGKNRGYTYTYNSVDGTVSFAKTVTATSTGIASVTTSVIQKILQCFR